MRLVLHLNVSGVRRLSHLVMYRARPDPPGTQALAYWLKLIKSPARTTHARTDDSQKTLRFRCTCRPGTDVTV
jgi:hypothetical protein